MKITFQTEVRKKIIIEAVSIKNLLRELDINPVEMIITKNDEIVPEDEMVMNEEEITVIKVVHGG